MVKLDRKRFIYDRIDGKLYLTRYYIFLKERNHFPFNIFLHQFHKSDDLVLHDHPWPYATLILKGGYWEIIPADCGPYRLDNGSINTKKVWRAAGHFRMCSAESFHRVELDPSVECWTLFMPGKQKRDWGFDVKGQWIHHEQYLNKRYENTRH